MAVPQILTFPAPLRKKPLLRRIKNTDKKLKRLLKIRIKLIKRSTQVTLRKHYFLSAAYRDAKSAFKQNEDIVVASVAASLILAYACAVIAAEFVVAFTHVTYAVAEATQIDMGVFILGLSPTILIFCSLLLALALNFMSISLMDGANRKIYRSIRSTFGRSLRLANRLVCAWALMGVVHFVRLLVIIVPMYVYVKWFSEVAVLSTEALLAFGLAGSLWWIYGVVRTSFVPYIALFEAQTLLTQAFGRSHELMKKQARTFIVTGTIVLSAYFYGLYKFGSYVRDDMGITTNLLFAIGILGGVMIANAGMVMLYRKRKLARVNHN